MKTTTKTLIPYVTGGITENWTDYLLAYQAAGADMIEIGLPFSDPMLDGPTIQQASDRALSRGATVTSVLADVAKLRAGNTHRPADKPDLPADGAHLSAGGGHVAAGGAQVSAGGAQVSAGAQVSMGGAQVSAGGVQISAGGAEVSAGGAEVSAGGAHLPADGAHVATDVSGMKVVVPLIVMTYANLVMRSGPGEFCRRLAAAGISGLIVPDLPVDELGTVEQAAADAGIDLILLAAPVTPDDRLAEIASRTRRFVYAVSVMGTTGERDALADSAVTLAGRIRAVSSRPVMIGFGVSGPAQAAAAGRAGDGVVVASALMRRVLDGATPDDLRQEVAALRRELDRCVQEDHADRTAHPEIPGHRG